ncbi:MAG: DoxX family protein [Gemmataceae bacterium]
MTRSAVFFLILLRLAIGWHFLVEGALKIPSRYYVQAGLEAPSGKSFSSAGYFREAAGPLGSVLRGFSGDSDQETLSRLTIEPIPAGRDPVSFPPQDQVPKSLKADWNAYLQRFASEYRLDPAQVKAAEALLDQAAARFVALLRYVPESEPARRDADPHFATFTTEQTRTYPSGEVKRRMTLGERVDEYRSKVQALQDTTDRKMWLFGKDVEGARLRTAKAEVSQLRSGLQADLDKQTKEFQDSLDKLLTPGQKEQGPMTERKDLSPIGWIDLITPWLLAGVGVCLLLGLFSRLAAFLGAGFLLMTYLAVPAFPWLPAPAQSEGTYLFVNKNVVEMLALCVFMCVPTGRWFGLDSILHVFRRLIFGTPKNETPVLS